jgi:hypothetical protein
MNKPDAVINTLSGRQHFGGAVSEEKVVGHILQVLGRELPFEITQAQEVAIRPEGQMPDDAERGEQAAG